MCSLFVPKTQTDNKGKPLGLPPCPSFLGLIRVNDKPLRGSLRESLTLHWQHKEVFDYCKNYICNSLVSGQTASHCENCHLLQTLSLLREYKEQKAR